MIIGGVLFGYFAGFVYWFPKIFGFKLNERLGKYALSCWIVGFLMAFVPLYILGLMGATRRLDHYDPSMGWQGLFIVAGVGVLIIILGIGFQLLQLIVSFRQRRANRDHTGDPWDGRTLEWATSSPAPFYNFAVIPQVDERDAFWKMKEQKTTITTPDQYQNFEMPRSTPMGMFIAAASFLVGFGLIWHIWWLAIVGLIGVVVLIIVRTFDDNTEYTVTADEIKRIELKAKKATI